MNPSEFVSSTQMILSWTLLGVLLAWMVFCAFLALRPQRAGKREAAADLPTPSGAFPAIVLQRATAPVDRSFGSMAIAASESASDVGSAPVA